MHSLSHWLEPDELALLPENISVKLDLRIQESHDSLVRIQNEYSEILSSYEKTVSQLSKNLQEQSQRYYELELKYLKISTEKNDFNHPDNQDISVRNMGKSPKLFKILKTKIKSLIALNSELQSKNKSLNSQIEFLIENKDIDTYESCSLAAQYLSELTELKSQLPSPSLIKTVENLKGEISILRKNEKIYQDYVYSKAKEIYEFENMNNNLKKENYLLLQYKQMYENIHSEYLKMSSTVTEIKIKNFEYKKMIENRAMLKTIYDYIVMDINKDKQNANCDGKDDISYSHNGNPNMQDINSFKGNNNVDGKDFNFNNSDGVNPIKQDINGSNYLNDKDFNFNNSNNKDSRVINNVKYNGEINTHGFDNKNSNMQDAISIFNYIKNDLISLESLLNNHISIKNEIEQFFSILLNMSQNIENSEFQFLKSENEILKAKISTLKPDSDLLNENEELKGKMKNHDDLVDKFSDLKTSFDELTVKYNDLKHLHDDLQLKNTQENLQSFENTNSQLSSTISELKKTLKTYEKEISENKVLIRDLRDEITRLDEEIMELKNEEYDINKEDKDYIRSLEDQLDSYKKDVKTIEKQFTEYRKLYESFNIENLNKKNEEKITVMRTNIERKDLLIESLYSLIGRYRRISEIFISQQ